jgi:eukaryotic-like serine/threonine-protein kinase
MPDLSERVGSYVLVRRLGAGGMAETFLAVQRGAAGFEQRVCVKFILPHLRDEAGFKAMFLREATIAASLRHSNIVGVIDVDQERGYIVLELVDGVDLRTLLNAAPNHRLPPALVALVAIELCKALSYAHGRTRHGEPYGVVHRDISPSNVLVSYAGEVKLADFGIAKAICSDTEPQSQTVKGKLCYMSPEQTRNEVLDGRSDLFALGIVCYELLSGRRPFDGQHDAETIVNVNHGKYVPLVQAAPDVPGGFAMVVEKLLSPDRAQRYASAEDVIDALERYAPPVTAYRALGDFARQARPHETLSTADMPAGEAHAPIARGATPSTRPMGMPASPGAPLARAPAVSRGAWLALSASLLVLIGVVGVWALRNEDAAAVPSAKASASGELKPMAAAPALVSVVPAAVVPAPAPTPIQVPTTPEPAPTSAEEAPARPRATGQATLRVGTMPLGQVWIDGKAAGWSPVVVQLPAGRHVVAGGSDTPVVRKELRLRPGERRQLVLNLEEASATASAEGR